MVIVLKKGDDVLPKLREWLERNRINSGFFYGIGGFQKAEIAFFDMAKKKFLKKKLPGPFEVLSMTGSVSQGEKGIVIHTHVALADKGFKVIGGHLMAATVKATLELKLTQTEILERVHDDETGLDLLK